MTGRRPGGHHVGCGRAQRGGRRATSSGSRRDGYTIIEDAIDLDALDALAADLRGLEELFDVAPATNGFEGTQTLRVYNLLASRRVWQRGARCTPTCCRSSRACSTPAASQLAVVDHDPARRDARNRSTPTTSSSRSPSRTCPRCATRCGRSPTSPRPTARRASSRARTSPTTRPTSAATTTPSRPRCRAAACSCGTAASGTAAARTAPTTTASASR